MSDIDREIEGLHETEAAENLEDAAPAQGTFYMQGRNWTKELRQYLRTHPSKTFRKRCYRCGMVAVISKSGQELLDNAEAEGRETAVICDNCAEKIEAQGGTVEDLGISEEQLQEVHKINLALDARARRN